MPFGVGTPCKKHGYPCLEPCPIAIEEENKWLRAKQEGKELLKILEWDHISTDNGDFVYCPICQAEYSTWTDKVKRVHKPDCKLKRYIDE